MLDIISLLRPYLEAAYFLSGIFLALGLAITYRQLYLIKRDIKLRNERASKERAIEATARYFNEFVPKTDACDGALRSAKLAGYEGPIGDFSCDSLKPDRVGSAFKRMIRTKSHEPLNVLESIAACFTTGVADEGTGFLIIGRTFCNSVEHYYDVIAACRSDKMHPYWHNIVQLYLIWRPRLTKAEMRNVQQELEAKIRSLGDDAKIDALGVS